MPDDGGVGFEEEAEEEEEEDVVGRVAVLLPLPLPPATAPLPPVPALALATVPAASIGKCRKATCQTLASVCVSSVMVERSKSINTPLVAAITICDVLEVLNRSEPGVGLSKRPITWPPFPTSGIGAQFT